MVSIPRPVERVRALIEPWGKSISVAAQNGPSSTVVTGNAAALDDLMAVCERDDVPATRIPVDYASHSAHVEALRETLRESLSGLQPRTGDIEFISAVTGAGLDTTILDGDYWFANLRQPVLFEQAVRWSYEHGYRTFIESSPHPVLTAGIQESLEDYGDDHSVVGTLRRNEGGMRRFLLSAAEAHVHGKSPNWESMFDDTGACRIDLPTYAFQRKRYWMDPGARIRRREQSRRQPPRSIRCSVRLWHKQIQTKSFSPVGCRSRLIRGWPTTKCTGSCSYQVRRWWSWRYTRATVPDARGWTNSCCRPR